MLWLCYGYPDLSWFSRSKKHPPQPHLHECIGRIGQLKLTFATLHDAATIAIQKSKVPCVQCWTIVKIRTAGEDTDSCDGSDLDCSWIGLPNIQLLVSHFQFPIGSLVQNKFHLFFFLISSHAVASLIRLPLLCWINLTSTRRICSSHSVIIFRSRGRMYWYQWFDSLIFFVFKCWRIRIRETWTDFEF